jgi:signal transduction histidine kinase
MKGGFLGQKKYGGIAALLLWSCLRASLWAQPLSFSFNHLGQEQGLAHAQCYSFFQDAFGFVWIGTDEGLERFDGQQIERFAVEAGQSASRKITSRCFEDARKDLWFSTFSSIGCYRRASGRFDFFAPNGLARTDFQAFHLDANGQLWLKAGSGAQAALFFLDTRSGQFQQKWSLPGERFAVVADAAGRVTHIAASKLPDQTPGFFLTDVRNGQVLPIEFPVWWDAESKKSTPVYNLLIEGDSVVWACLYNRLGKYDLRRRTATATVARAASVAADFGFINDVVAYDADRLLVACTDGLVVFDKRENKFVQQFRYQAQVPGSLRSGEVAALYRDPSDGLWLSGPGGGIAFAHLRKHKFPVLPATVGQGAVSGLFEDKNGQIWCSSADASAQVFDQAGHRLLQSQVLKNWVQPNQPFPLPPISTFLEDGESGFWGFSENYLFNWESRARRFEFRAENFFGVASSESDLLRAHCQLADGTRLVAQGGAVFQVKMGAAKVQLLRRADLESFGLQEVTAIFQNRKGQLFLADNQYRIVVLELGKAKKIADIQGVAVCNSFAETDDGTVWAATSNGLLRLQPGTFEGTLLSEKKDGCPSEEYYNALPDRQGFLWLTGNNGLVRYDRACRTHHRFGTADGLLSKQFGLNTALLASKTGDFWVGGKNGVNVFRPENILLLDAQPPVQITQLLVNDTAFHAGMDLSVLERLELSYTQNTLSFQFAALDFSAPGENRYFYRMKGVERDSVPNGKSGFVRYANLPPGTYTFEVWATNSDGLLSPAPRRLQLYIRAPWWQTWWFYLLCAFSLAGLVYAWFWYRLQQALRIERMRVEISSDLHDDVGTLLAGLAMQSEALELSAPEKDKPKLRRISDISRSAMGHMRDTVWAIDARKDKVENLLDRMREHAEETLTPRDFRFEIEVENVSLKQNLPTNIRQNLYLIFKEAVTNAAKHSNGDTVLATLKKTDSGFEMRICDNGQVAEKAYKTTGLGTSNMAMRAEKIGGKLEISRENGFCVVVRLGRLG